MRAQCACAPALDMLYSAVADTPIPCVLPAALSAHCPQAASDAVLSRCDGMFAGGSRLVGLRLPPDHPCLPRTLIRPAPRSRVLVYDARVVYVQMSLC